MTIKMVVFSLLAIMSSFNVFSDELPRDNCSSLYQSWVFNVAIEDACEFGGAIARKLGIIIKSKCDAELPENVRNRLGLEVAMAINSDIKRMGLNEFCKSAKPGYDDVVSILSRSQTTK